MAPPIKREDLIVPYVHVKPATEENAGANFVSQSMPMAAMFMRNKLLSWFSIFSAVTSLLYELHGDNSSEGQSGLLRLVTAVVGLAVTYMELVFPGSTLGPQGKLKKAAAEVSETISAGTATGTN